MSANEVNMNTPVNNLPDLPIWTGPTLEPRCLGPDAFITCLAQILIWLPNREMFIERRRQEVNAVAPVRFKV